ncbi:PIN domain-containing protein [Candidatus Acetothermia bacterium]|jgi:predicted nucleic acid-binding protein|nr:PIN domain-containing protein [Candidatus Acetothermia bacterium]
MFVDTSAFYALADMGDRNHLGAKAFYESLVGKKRLITTDHVLLECWFLIGSKLGREKALAFWDGLRSGIVSIVSTRGEDLERAREILGEFKDQDFSLTDATSCAVMERVREREVFSFDKHFRVYRYGTDRKRTFSVFP